MTMNMHAANALNEAKLPTPREEPADAYFSSDGSSSDSDETGMEVSEKPPVPEHGAAVAGMGQKGEQGEGGGLKISRRELEQAGFEDWQADLARQREAWKKIDLKQQRISDHLRAKLNDYINYQVFCDAVFTVADQAIGMLQNNANPSDYYTFFARMFKEIFIPIRGGGENSVAHASKHHVSCPHHNPHFIAATVNPNWNGTLIRNDPQP